MKNKTKSVICITLFWIGTCFLLSPSTDLTVSADGKKLPSSVDPEPASETDVKLPLIQLAGFQSPLQIPLKTAAIESGPDATTWPSDPSGAEFRVSPTAASASQPITRGRSDDDFFAPPTFDRASLTDEDKVLLANLPPICMSDLPGLNLNEQNQGITLALLGTAMNDLTGFGGATAQAQAVNHLSNYPNPDGLRLEESKSETESFDSRSSSGNAHSILMLEQAHWEKERLLEPAFREAHSDGPQSDRLTMLPPQAKAIQASLSPHSAAGPAINPQPGTDPHFELYSRTPFPSAVECAQCHQQIFDEWASSSHAYASISPMFHAFEDTINRLSQGTIGYFCMRCHAPVATTMGLRRDQAIWDGPRVFREGVTCVACHRVKSIYTKANGERRIEPGDIYDPVYGSGSGEGVEIANKYAQFFKFKTDPQDSSLGQPIHQQAIQFEEMKESSYCMSCHHVQVKPGIKLEVVWDQYRASPAYRDGITCQDCHMGKVPGVAGGYSVGPAAVFEGKVVNPERRHSNHVFYGPGYSIAHPGIFPHDTKADRWTVNQWLEFDWRAGWGTEAFEDAIATNQIAPYFPPIWRNPDDRLDAREIVDRNLKKLEYKKDLRRQVLENGSKLDGPFFTKTPQVNQKLNFYYCLTSLNSGHNMPSGSLGAQPQIWMNVVLIDPAGNRIWETGYLDSQGDLADRHSSDVLARRIPYDAQLMNLQTRFLTTNVKGTDRETYLPINFDIDQLPFLRPAAQPVSVLNHPPLIRMEAHSLPPLGSRNVKYSIPAKRIQMPGTYRLSVRMRSRAEPIYFMKFCNATPEMIRSMNEWIANFHIQSVLFEVQ